MPVLKHHLIPRTKGFTASLPFLKKKCPVILDIQLAFKKNDPVEPTIGNLLRGRAVTGYMHVRRIETKSLPDNEAEAAEWLQEFFRFKDKLQDSFHTHGDFFTGTGLKPIEPVRKSTYATPRKYCRIRNLIDSFFFSSQNRLYKNQELQPLLIWYSGPLLRLHQFCTI